MYTNSIVKTLDSCHGPKGTQLCKLSVCYLHAISLGL